MRIVGWCLTPQVAVLDFSLDLPFSISYSLCSPRLILPLYTYSSCAWHVLWTEPVPSVSTRTVPPVAG